MKFALATYAFRNNDVEFNLTQIEHAMGVTDSDVDFLCFGEAFLQGFDALNWDYAHDIEISVSQSSAVMKQVSALVLQYKINLMLGYIERDGEDIYCSYAIIIDGKIKHNYRRISEGWKQFDLTNEHYKEGHDTEAFEVHGHEMLVAMCGDMWVYPERFKTDGVLIWPNYVNFSVDEWERSEEEYAEQARVAANDAVVINSISQNPDAHGGAFYFQGGKIIAKQPYDKEGILIVEIP